VAGGGELRMPMHLSADRCGLAALVASVSPTFLKQNQPQNNRIDTRILGHRNSAVNEQCV